MGSLPAKPTPASQIFESLLIHFRYNARWPASLVVFYFL
jgi:hypothetical protein